MTAGAARQKGFGIYVIILILGAAAAVTVISVMSSRSLQTREQVEQANILGEAKRALLGWAITRGSTSSPGADRPGDLPAPDVLDSTESPPNYDGDPETRCMDASTANGLPLTAASTNVRCLGRLPWLTLKMSFNAAAEKDESGNAKVGEQDVEGKMPWYAVSASLTRIDSCLTVLNSNTAGLPYAGYTCASAANLPYPWLTVRDTRGNILSNRVAFVLLLPGAIIGSQQRRGAPNLGGASQYLDSITVPAGCATPCVPGTYSNADLDNDFIAGDSTDSFNDKLIYATIDELIPAIEKQVASTVRGIITDFAKCTAGTNCTSSAAPAPSSYFWLRPFDPTATPTPSGPATVGTQRGLLPFVGTADFSGSSFRSGFQWSTTLTPSVSVSGTVTAAEVRAYTVAEAYGSCVWSTFYASLPHRSVECTATIPNPTPGIPSVTSRTITLRYATSGTTVSYSTNPAAVSNGVVISPATATSHATRSVRRTSISGVTLVIRDYNASGTQVGSGTFSGTTGRIRTQGISIFPESANGSGNPFIAGRFIPSWFFTNQWDRISYVAISSDYAPGSAGGCSSNCFSVLKNGTSDKTGIRGVVVMPGTALASQTRPNTTPSNYFDNATNQNTSTLVFDHANTLTSTFNDQVIVIAP
jgi:hypothetical protein